MTNTAHYRALGHVTNTAHYRALSHVTNIAHDRASGHVTNIANDRASGHGHVIRQTSCTVNSELQLYIIVSITIVARPHCLILHIGNLMKIRKYI